MEVDVGLDLGRAAARLVLDAVHGQRRAPLISSSRRALRRPRGGRRLDDLAHLEQRVDELLARLLVDLPAQHVRIEHVPVDRRPHARADLRPRRRSAPWPRGAGSPRERPCARRRTPPGCAARSAACRPACTARKRCGGRSSRRRFPRGCPARLAVALRSGSRECRQRLPADPTYHTTFCAAVRQSRLSDMLMAFDREMPCRRDRCGGPSVVLRSISQRDMLSSYLYRRLIRTCSSTSTNRRAE